MDVQMMPQLLGVSQYTASMLKMGKLPGSLGNISEAELFDQRLADRMDMRDSKAGLEDHMSQSWLQHRINGNSIRDKIMLQYRAPAIEDNDESVTDENTVDDPETDSAVTESSGTQNDDPGIDTNGTVDVQSAKDIVFATGAANLDLINSINNASTYQERIQYAEQLRDKIIEALKEGGHEAYDIGKPDKISIDGNLYDVIQRSRAMGKDAAVQFLDVPVETQSLSMKRSIMDAGESVMDLLTQISNSTSTSQRRQLAEQFRDAIIADLKENGIEATAKSPDKIQIGNETYDILRSLNNPGATVTFQAIKV